MDVKDKLHVCFLVDRFSISGRASKHGFLIPVARGLARKGHKITVVSGQSSSYNETSLQEDNLKVHFVKGMGRRLEVAFRKQLVEVYEKKPFHILYIVCKKARFVAKLKKKYPFCVILDARSTEVSQLYSIISMSRSTFNGEIKTGLSVLYKFITNYYRKDRKLLKMSDALIVTNPREKNIFERYYLYPDWNTYILPYGIEIVEPSGKKKNELMKSFKLSYDQQIIATVTDMTVKEEVFPILKAFQKVVIKKPSSRMILVGTAPLSREIERKIYDLVLGNKVIVVGPVSHMDVTAYISLCDIFIDLSARTSGFEPSLLEAMSQKKVIIGSETGPISTIVENQTEGFLIRPFDKAFLEELIFSIFNKKIDSVEIGEKAHKKINHFFEPHIILEKTISTYFDTLKKSMPRKKLKNCLTKFVTF